MKNNLKIYIVHYTKLTERKIYLDNLLKDKNIEFEYINEFDQEELNQNNIGHYYKDDEDLFLTQKVKSGIKKLINITYFPILKFHAQ